MESNWNKRMLPRSIFGYLDCEISQKWNGGYADLWNNYRILPDPSAPSRKKRSKNFVIFVEKLSFQNWTHWAGEPGLVILEPHKNDIEHYFMLITWNREKTEALRSELYLWIFREMQAQAARVVTSTVATKLVVKGGPGATSQGSAKAAPTQTWLLNRLFNDYPQLSNGIAGAIFLGTGIYFSRTLIMVP